MNICKIPYTKNNNGYYFNLTSITPEVMKKIKECISNVINNRKIMEDLNKERDSIIKEYKILESQNKEYIEKKVLDTISYKKFSNISMVITKIVPAVKYVDVDKLFLDYKKKQELKNKNFRKKLKIMNTSSEKYLSISSNTQVYQDNTLDYEIDREMDVDVDMDMDVYADINYEIDEEMEVDQVPLEEEIEEIYEIDEGYIDDIQDIRDIHDVGDIHDIESDYSDESLTTNITTQDIQSSIRLYREILSKKGLVFNVCNYDILKYQPYIL